ncbi:DUF2971 domain-containing protein [Altererythrobacter sp. ZODW24]|uniref:DUF2971 domain-containing protein n=1 Tax=Altererythrobacter sp. ZODW24 TaxID=2185142 RepID=UPI000DF78872|nr:DUF2971 domain-containing protein [Altererythrobacter sp. ZODW24]
MAKSSGTLRRYTNVLSLLDILNKGRLTLLSPDKWYDQNDAFGLKRYAELPGKGATYALCFAEGSEQAHHWQIFAGDSHGVAVIFDKAKLLKSFERFKHSSEIMHGAVQYRNLTQMNAMGHILPEQLPFLKRDAFAAEEEYRVIAWKDASLDTGSYQIPIDLSSIAHIFYGPNMPEALAVNLKEIVRELNGCTDITFSKSKVVNNASWEKAISKGLRP